MPDIVLPVPGSEADKNVWGTKVNTAISVVNNATDANTEAIDDLQTQKENVLTAGTNITINRTDPDNPVISATGGGGGGGAVDSVNGQTGVVVLDADDLADGTSKVQMTTAERTKLSGIASGAQVNTVASVAGKTGVVTLAKADVGLANVDNTSDANKPVSTATQTALDGKAASVHTHSIAQVTSLQAELDSKADDTDLAALASDIVDLDTALDGKEAVLTAGANITINRSNPAAPIISASGGGGGAGDWGSIGGTLSDQTDLQVALDAKADSADLGTAAEADSTDFATAAQGAKADTAVQPAALSGYVPTTRTINGAALSANVTLTAGDVGAAATSHTHTASQVTDLTEAVEDIIGSAVVGTGLVSASYNDTTGDTTISTTATANSTDSALRDRSTHTGTQSADTITDGTTNKAYTGTEQTKLAGIATGATANATNAQLRDRSTHTGTQSADTLTDGTTNKAYTATEQTKLAGIATGATANSSDATLLARANHTGTQAASTISDFSTAADARVAAATDLVRLTGNQTVAGTKTFSSAPAVPDASFAIAKTSGLQTALDAKAPLASPALTGNPTAPTPSAGDSDTSIATTAFVNTNLRLPIAVTSLPGSPVAGQFYVIVPTL